MSSSVVPSAQLMREGVWCHKLSPGLVTPDPFSRELGSLGTRLRQGSRFGLLMGGVSCLK